MAKAESTTQLDILGILATDMGMTGENISREIFSYVDIFSLMRGRMVSKTWNRYLSQQKCIWMAHLRKTLSFLDYFEEMAQDIRMLFDSLEENGKVEDIICVFQTIQCMAFFNYHASNHAMSLNFGFYFAFEVPNFGNPEIFLWKDKALKKEVDKFVDKQLYALKSKEFRELNALFNRPENSSIDWSMLIRISSFDGNTASACSLMKDYCKDVQKKNLEKLVCYLQHIQQLTQEDSVAK